MFQTPMQHTIMCGYMTNMLHGLIQYHFQATFSWTTDNAMQKKEREHIIIIIIVVVVVVIIIIIIIIITKAAGLPS